MRSPDRRFTRLGLTSLVLLAACGSDAEPAVEQAAAEPERVGVSFAEIPREQLYGATRAETLWSPKFELEVLDLPAGWDGARIAILSDFHLGLWDQNEEVATAAVKRAIDSDADFIALLGDYAETTEDLPALREVLAPLSGRGAVAVLGDRDVRSDSLAAAIAGVLEERGVTLLRSTAAAVVVGGDTAWVAGLDAEVLQRGFAEQQYIVATLGPPGRIPILLTHIPALTTRAPDGRFPVMLAGNTFCGQVEIAAAPRLSWLANEVFPGGRIEGLDRLFRVQGGTVLVTCGIGYGFVPIRFGAPPEVPILTLRRLGETATDSAQVTDEGAVADSLIRSYQGTEEEPDSI